MSPFFPVSVPPQPHSYEWCFRPPSLKWFFLWMMFPSPSLKWLFRPPLHKCILYLVRPPSPYLLIYCRLWITWLLSVPQTHINKITSTLIFLQLLFDYGFASTSLVSWVSFRSLICLQIHFNKTKLAGYLSKTISI